MSFTISIGPVSENPNSVVKVAFGKNVSADRVICYVQSNTQWKQECGLISNLEATEIMKQTEEKLKTVGIV